MLVPSLIFYFVLSIHVVPKAFSCFSGINIRSIISMEVLMMIEYRQKRVHKLTNTFH